VGEGVVRVLVRFKHHIPDIDCLAFQSHLNRENMLSARSLAPLAGRVTVAILLASS